MASTPLSLLLFILIFLYTPAVLSRSISTIVNPTDLVSSDGQLSYLSLPNAREPSCKQSYGILPCTNTVIGNLFLLMVYGYLLFLGATFLSNGSELLLDILGPGVIGGLLLPMLGALPDAILIFVSGLSGSKETAQQQVLIGMGLLAGSTVMLLTLLWGTCVVVGKCDFSSDSQAIDSQDNNNFSLSESGISTDVQTSHAAKILVVSVVPFIIVQLPAIFGIPSKARLMVLIGLVVSVTLLLAYCLYQAYQPWIFMRRLQYAKLKHVFAGFLRHANAQTSILGKLVRDDGSPNESVIEMLFKRINKDEDSYITHPELRAFLAGMSFQEDKIDFDDAVNKLMVEFDTSRDNFVDGDEFKQGITKWINIAKSNGGPVSEFFFEKFYEQAGREHDQLLEGNNEEDNEGEVEKKESNMRVWVKALALLLLGTVIAAVFADPLVDAVTEFSSATHIPSFFISFIAMPLATNSSEAVSAIIFASRKKQKTASLTFSEIYGSATMNNTLCLSVFLAIVYVRGLTWDFSAEVLVILLVCIIMGTFASFRTTFPLWTSFIAFLLYPLSLLLVYVLDYVLGWS